MPPNRQLDLFSASGAPAGPTMPAAVRPPIVPAAALDDSALVAAIPDAGIAACKALADEAGRRRLVCAVPALETLCRRFKGFGLHNPVPEQIAALRGLVAIAGRDAAAAVERLIADAALQGPGLGTAVAAAASLRCRLAPDIATVLLRHPDPDMRANAACCAPPRPAVIALLNELLHDLNSHVAQASACALGRMGRPEARVMLVRLLHEKPSPDVIDAVIPIADEACIVTLGRIARSRPDLAGHVVAALDDIDSDRAAAVARGLRRMLG